MKHPSTNQPDVLPSTLPTRRRPVLRALGAAGALGALGVSPASAAVEGVVESAPTTCAELAIQALVMGRDRSPVGDVSVVTDETSLFVKLDADSDHPFSEVHVAAATTLEGIPVNKAGNAVPGEFRYGGDLETATTTITLEVPYDDLSGVESGDSVYLAVHAGVGEGAWADGDLINVSSGSWALYFTVAAVLDCGCGSVLSFDDPALEQAVRDQLRKPTGDITPEEGERVTFLDAEGYGIESLGGIECLPNLSVILLADNNVSDISALAELPPLRSLNINRNEVSDLSPLSSLSKMQWLFATDNRIADVSPLAELPRLGQLVLNGNEVSDLSPLSSLRYLGVLIADNNQIADLRPLDGVPLVRLHASNNNLPNLDGLSNSSRLRYLEVRGNQITDISGIAGLPYLSEFAFDDNQVIETSPLLTVASKLVFFNVYASNNEIVDLDPLYLLRFKLETLHIDGNPFDCSDPLLIEMRVIPNFVTGC